MRWTGFSSVSDLRKTDIGSNESNVSKERGTASKTSKASAILSVAIYPVEAEEGRNKSTATKRDFN